jgi:phosphatidate cytidylyltransferase
LVTFKITIVLIPFVIFTIAIFKKGMVSFTNALFTIGGILYAVLPFALLNELVCLDVSDSESNFNPMLILGIIFLIWSNDTFAYLGGSIFGKNKMIERISPGKTWEGTAIGVFVTFGLSFSFGKLVYPLDNWIWQVLGIGVPILATIGDLLESKLKREAGIKDSGNIMPGHGGILDRFDSLIFVSPFVYAFFMLLKA